MEHGYGSHVHILSNPYLFTTLSKLCSPECKQPVINQLLHTLYRELTIIVANNEFPEVGTEITTRMFAQHPEGKFRASIVEPRLRVVCVNLARAGTVPSQICFDAFNYLLNSEGIRQDHISINRRMDEREKVIGTDLGGVKIGGDVGDAYVIFPDPMGATGSTICSAMEIYQKRGRALKFVAVHLIVTPEYLARVTRQYPELSIYAIRLDRGLSSPAVLQSTLGENWSEERGLNDKHYIVPGAGGLGEIINNCYV